MKIVIAGATGLIGKLLTRNLLDSGHSVVVLTRNPPKVLNDTHPFLQVIQWNERAEDQWQRHLERSDAVVNLSGASLGAKRWTGRRKQILVSSRINPTARLVDAIGASSTKPKVLINASAVGYYGSVENADVTEDHPAGDDFAGWLCTEWERTALRANEFGVRTILMRSAIVLDPLGGALQRMILPYKLFAGGPIGSGKQWLPWIHREDEIRALCFAIENDRVSGPVNFAAPEPATMRDFSTALGRALKRPSFVRVPSFVLRALLGEMADIVLTGQRIIPQKLLNAGFAFRFHTLKAAFEDLLSSRIAAGH